MIETREDYEKFKAHSLTIWKSDAVETIEALREVARAAKTATDRLKMLQEAGPLGMSPKWTQDLMGALDALPPWLLEEPDE